jgi:uncharacterized protein YqfA (UPF0365 family)
MPSPTYVLIGCGIVIIFALVVFLQFAALFRLWLRGRTCGVDISIPYLLAMGVRRVPPGLIIDSCVTATQAGIPLQAIQLEAHHLAGGDVPQVVSALVTAHRAGIPLTFNRACAIDLAGKGSSQTVLAAVHASINPKVIDCPPAGMGRGGKIEAVAKDGVPLRVRARVTVRTCLDRFVGGAGEETLIARIGEGIVTAIASTACHRDLVENPDRISRLLLAKGLDAGTAFEILSIDVASIDVGES